MGYVEVCEGVWQSEQRGEYSALVETGRSGYVAGVFKGAREVWGSTYRDLHAAQAVALRVLGNIAGVK